MGVEIIMFDGLDDISKNLGKRGHNEFINLERPYNKEIRRLRILINFGSISNYFAVKCLKEFINREHNVALLINKQSSDSYE